MSKKFIYFLTYNSSLFSFELEFEIPTILALLIELAKMKLKYYCKILIWLKKEEHYKNLLKININIKKFHQYKRTISIKIYM